MPGTSQEIDIKLSFIALSQTKTLVFFFDCLFRLNCSVQMYVEKNGTVNVISLVGAFCRGIQYGGNSCSLLKP